MALSGMPRATSYPGDRGPMRMRGVALSGISDVDRHGRHSADQYSSMSLTRVAVHMRPSAGVPGRLPVEGRLHALRPGDLDPRPRQVDGVHGEGEALARGQRVAELELAGVAGDRLVHQHLVGEAHLDAAGQRGDRRIGAVDAAVAADGLDAVEVVGVGDLGRDHVAERRAVAGDAAVEVAEALQRQLGRRAGGGGGARPSRPAPPASRSRSAAPSAAAAS